MKRWAVFLAAGALVAGTAIVQAATAQAATGCRVDYSVANQWPGGFQGGVTVVNTGAALTSWTVGFSFPTAGQKVTQSWNSTFSQSGSAVTFSSASWNASLATNGSATLGFLGTFGATNPTPTQFTVNGVSCTGSTPNPTPVPTPAPVPSPKPTATPPAPTPTPKPTASAPTPKPTVPAPSPTATAPAPTPAGAAPALKVSGNRLVTASGATYRMLGVNRSGGEFACIQGNGIWNGPMDAASVDAMRKWKVRVVRVPLNEECWLGTSDVQAAYGGAIYQSAIKDYVNLLISKGITPIVEMHWNYGLYTGNSSGCSDVKATCQKPMPDAQYAPSFWTGVAKAFKGNDAVVFDLFNEPYPERATGDTTSGWKCWRDGGTCAGIGYQVAGFQTLVNSVRATGATNVIMIGGLAYSNDLSQWLTYKPTDPLNNIAAFAHVYNFNTCNNVSCWNSTFLPVAAKVPFTLTEIGENTCSHGFVDPLMDWADTNKVGYLGWTWNNWDCSTGPSLITDWAGTPTAYGLGLQARLAAVSN